MPLLQAFGVADLGLRLINCGHGTSLGIKAGQKLYLQILPVGYDQQDLVSSQSCQHGTESQYSPVVPHCLQSRHELQSKVLSSLFCLTLQWLLTCSALCQWLGKGQQRLPGYVGSQYSVFRSQPGTRGHEILSDSEFYHILANHRLGRHWDSVPFSYFQQETSLSCCAPWSSERGVASKCFLPTLFIVTFLIIILQQSTVVSHLVSVIPVKITWCMNSCSDCCLCTKVN